ncbi:hypothetical protein ACIBI9_37755 [Nonomuraea sp. NPDC050451]|uniref:hypothetical protein n=1 Tax=Nonomuraea sp. NPDC050451 TaxID=3364364 RepID=UPI0037958884
MKDAGSERRQPLVYTPFAVASLPMKWTTQDPKTLDEDPTRAQLVICMKEVRKRSSTPMVGRCTYPALVAAVYPATYTFEVYEACASGFSYPVGSEVEIAQDIKEKTLHRRLRPLIMGPVR